MGKKLAPLCGKMRVNSRAQKVHVFDHKKNLHPSAVKCVQILGTKNASGQMSLLNTNAGLAEILRTEFWSLVTLAMTAGRLLR